jgi:thioredoxin-like negative regulator of GroEL
VPGKAYDPVGWELWAPLRPQYEAGDYDPVMDRLQEIVAESPQYPLLAYNLACLESLTGHRDDALEHLGRSIAMSTGSATSRRAIPTSTRSATTPASWS